MDSQQTYAAVSEHYSSVSSNPTQLGEGYTKAVAQSFGYSEEELASIPADSNLGVSCGNPLGTANLKEGETVIDLGSGGGLDVFLAAAKVGPTGRAIGVDMNKDMLALAEKNKGKSGGKAAEFIEAQIDNIPLADGTADVVISNCVINLVPEEEKQLVFNEISRLLKPGGRVAISDILAKQPLPEKVRQCAAAHVGCVAGASLVAQYQAYLKQAGFNDVLIIDAAADLNVYIDTLPKDGKKTDGNDNSGQSCCGPSEKGNNNQSGCGPSKKDNSNQSSCRPSVAAETLGCCSGTGAGSVGGLDVASMAAELGGMDLNKWIGSYKIFAVKP